MNIFFLTLIHVPCKLIWKLLLSHKNIISSSFYSWKAKHGQNLTFLIQLSAGLPKITILVSQQKFIMNIFFLTLIHVPCKLIIKNEY
jgi:hypothetical protein